MAVSDSVSARSVRQIAIIGMATDEATKALIRHAVAAKKVRLRRGKSPPVLAKDFSREMGISTRLTLIRENHCKAQIIPLLVCRGIIPW